jgi:hypothetical protein
MRDLSCEWLFLNRAPNAVFCDQGVSEQIATISIFAKFSLPCVILLPLIDVTFSFSPCRERVSRLCAIWQRIFWPCVVCRLL